MRISVVTAHILSALLHPGILAIVVFLLYPGWVLPAEIPAVIALMALVLLIPAALMIYEVRKAGDKDLTMRSRTKRYMPLAIQSVLLFAASAVTLGLLHLTFEAQRYVLLLTALITVLWLITYKWKISLHMAGTTFLSLHFWLVPPFPYAPWMMFPLVSIPLLAAWARWRLHVHTPQQLLGGLGLGMAAASGVLLIY